MEGTTPIPPGKDRWHNANSHLNLLRELDPRIFQSKWSPGSGASDLVARHLVMEDWSY